MRTLKRIPVTKEGFENLKQKLADLKSERPSAVKTLSEARAMGDLSENGLYTAAKARLRGIDSEIFRVEMQIKLADIMEGSKNEVKIGSRVEVINGENKITYHIVGDYEANPSENKISQKAPLGHALIGKSIGDEARVETPSGSINLKIIGIS